MGDKLPHINFWLLIIVILALTGVGYKVFIAPTNKTIIANGGRQVIIQQDGSNSEIPLVGCSAYKLMLKLNWQKARNMPAFKTEVKK